VPSFDGRTNSELQEAALDHPVDFERERAVWEYGYRLRWDSLSFVHECYSHEQLPAIRWNLLWLAVKLLGDSAIPLLEEALSDPEREVRDWARIFLKEIADVDLASEYSEGVYTPHGPFDQTLPLQISGFALVSIPGVGSLRATLSPLWFEHVLGRVLACTNLDTFMSELTIEKCIAAYHPDGTNHYEIFPFSGISWQTGEGQVQHRYESHSRRLFYRSGKVEDESKEVIRDVPVILNRGAESSGSALTARPVVDRDLLFASRGSGPRSAPDLTDARGIRLLNGNIVTTVGGTFFGWGAFSVEHYIHYGKVLPGTVQLANPLYDATRDMVNTYLCGSFRGKIGDFDGDGKLDINLIPCHGTPAGQLDYHADGSLAPDPFA
jgi:hypothetical protein